MRTPVYKGVNAEGNCYTVYDDGSFSYKNTNQEGKTTSAYFNTAQGHGFYRKNGPAGYQWHENQKQGTRNYIEKKSKSKKDSGNDSC